MLYEDGNRNGKGVFYMRENICPRIKVQSVFCDSFILKNVQDENGRIYCISNFLFERKSKPTTILRAFVQLEILKCIYNTLENFLFICLSIYL